MWEVIYLPFIIAVGSVAIIMFILRFFDLKYSKNIFCNPKFFKNGKEHCFHKIDKEELKVPHGRFPSTKEIWIMKECCKCGMKVTDIVDD